MLVLHGAWDHLVLLCWIASSPLILAWLFLVVLLSQHNLLFFQNLDLISILNWSRPLGVRRSIGWDEVDLVVLVIFLIILILKAELVLMRSVSFSGQRVINYVDMWILLLVRVSTWILIQYLNILLNVLLLNRPPVSGVSSPLISGWALVSLLLHLHHSSGLSISILSLVLNTFSILLLSLNLLHRLLLLNLSDFLAWPILWLWLVLFLLHDLLVLELDLVVMHLLLVHVHEVIRLYLHLLKHGIDVWVVHCKLLSDFILLPHFLIDDGLVLLLVVGWFVSLMGSGLLAVNFWIDHWSRSGLDMPPLIHLLLWMVSLVWL